MSSHDEEAMVRHSPGMGFMGASSRGDKSADLINESYFGIICNYKYYKVQMNNDELKKQYKNTLILVYSLEIIILIQIMHAVLLINQSM